MILAVLVSVGSFFLTKDNTTYGNSVNFYLSRKDPQQVLLPILQSESFAEKLLLDEYGVYGFEDIFGDPSVSVTAEPTHRPVSIDLRDQLSGFHDEASMEKIYNAYLPLLLSLNPAYAPIMLSDYTNVSCVGRVIGKMYRK